MPYRIDVPNPPADALDRLVRLGALDVESAGAGVAAILPDAVTPETARALLATDLRVSSAAGYDDGSVWILSQRAVRVAGLVLAPPGAPAPPGALQLTDASAFGSGLHPTTALCLEALDDALAIQAPHSVLDVGTGSGVLALAALMKGVPGATAIDTDARALAVAAGHARVNGLEARLVLKHGGPDVVAGTWPLVLANVLAAPLIEMAPTLVRRVGHRGRLVLSGIPVSVVPDVERAYRRLGMRLLRPALRAGWAVVVADASW